MPVKQKKITSYPASQKNLHKSVVFKRRNQRTLDDLENVCRIKGGGLNFDISELTGAKAALESHATSVPEILAILRRLSCLTVSKSMLIETSVGSAVRRMKQHRDLNVARIATALVEKWKARVLQERR